MQEEQQWAQELRRSRHQHRKAKAMDFSIAEEKIRKDLAQYVAELEKASKTGDKKRMEALLPLIFKTRAELAAVTLAQEKEQFDTLDDSSIEEIVEEFFHDTMMLNAAVKQS